MSRKYEALSSVNTEPPNGLFMITLAKMISPNWSTVFIEKSGLGQHSSNYLGTASNANSG